MSALRERMIEDMQLHGLSENTKKAYVRSVQKLAEYYQRSPDQITEEELREYFLYLINVRKIGSSYFRVSLCGIKFFYEHTLGKSWVILDLARPPKKKKLPVILSTEEVRQILGHVQQTKHFVCLSTIYACGLRIAEATNLQIKDIDGNRQTLHVCNGKGGKDRYVPLPHPVLKMLRRYWVTHHHPVLLFPSPRGADGHLTTMASKPITPRSVQRAFKYALQESDIQKAATVHSLRHAYATHLLEAGVRLRVIQAYLGHASPTSTAVYTHLTQESNSQAMHTINQVLGNLWL
jgi:site-specific recombinase XerD